MKEHTRIGAEILGQNRSKLMRLSEEIALSHHEHWDGGGYPNGLAGEGIPTSGRIVAVADVFDALTHKRPYKPAWTVVDSVHEMQRLAGLQFDPVVIDAFNQLDPNELAWRTPFDTPLTAPHLRAVGTA
jgi:putative two-component system response regulator